MKYVCYYIYEVGILLSLGKKVCPKLLSHILYHQNFKSIARSPGFMSAVNLTEPRGIASIDWPVGYLVDC